MCREMEKFVTPPNGKFGNDVHVRQLNPVNWAAGPLLTTEATLVMVVTQLKHLLRRCLSFVYDDANCVNTRCLLHGSTGEVKPNQIWLL